MSRERIFRRYRPGDRKKYYRRNGALDGDPLVLREEDRKTKRARVMAEVHGWLKFGVARISGNEVRIECATAEWPAVEARLRALIYLERKLVMCHARNGARCQSDKWYRVAREGVAIEIMQVEAVSSPLTAVSSNDV